MSFEDLCKRRLFQREPRLPGRTLGIDNALDTAALLVAPGQKGCAGRAAHGTVGVIIGELHAGFGQCVDVRRLDLGAAVTADITVPKVVGHYQNDVGLAGRPRTSPGLTMTY